MVGSHSWTTNVLHIFTRKCLKRSILVCSQFGVNGQQTIQIGTPREQMPSIQTGIHGASTTLSRLTPKEDCGHGDKLLDLQREECMESLGNVYILSRLTTRHHTILKGRCACPSGGCTMAILRIMRNHVERNLYHLYISWRNIYNGHNVLCSFVVDRHSKFIYLVTFSLLSTTMMAVNITSSNKNI